MPNLLSAYSNTQITAGCTCCSCRRVDLHWTSSSEVVYLVWPYSKEERRVESLPLYNACTCTLPHQHWRRWYTRPVLRTAVYGKTTWTSEMKTKVPVCADISDDLHGCSIVHGEGKFLTQLLSRLCYPNNAWAWITHTNLPVPLNVPWHWTFAAEQSWMDCMYFRHDIAGRKTDTSICENNDLRNKTYGYPLFFTSAQHIHPILYRVPAAFSFQDIWKLYLHEDSSI